MGIYVGQEPSGPYKLNKSAKAVVERLHQHIFKTIRNITTDNWFSSIPLAHLTMRKDKEFPDLFT